MSTCSHPRDVYCTHCDDPPVSKRTSRINFLNEAISNAQRYGRREKYEQLVTEYNKLLKEKAYP